MRNYDVVKRAAVLGVLLGSSFAAQTADATVGNIRSIGARCTSPVAVLGADLTPGDRAAVRGDLAPGATTPVLTESFANEQSEAHGIIPSVLLGRLAVSSVLLVPRAPGAGMSVLLNPHVSVESAQAFANALLTAGVTDASVHVAAPAAQTAYGTTALLGMLRAARTACPAVTTARTNLAMREFVLTDALAGTAGYRVAPLLMARLKSDAAAGQIVAPLALQAVIVRDALRLHTSVPGAQVSSVTVFLADLLKSRFYNGIAAAGPQFGQPLLQNATVSFIHPVGAPSLLTGGILHGTAIVGASETTLEIRVGDAMRSFAPAAGIPVFRNSRHVSLSAIRRSDQVSVTTGESGQAVRIEAISSGSSIPPVPVGGLLYHGTVAAAVIAGSSVLIVKEGGIVRTLGLVPDVSVYRNGALSSLSALRPSDAVTGKTNATGVTTRIDATSQSTAGINVLSIVGLLIPLFLLLFLLWLVFFALNYRRRAQIVTTKMARAASIATVKRTKPESNVERLRDGGRNLTT